MKKIFFALMLTAAALCTKAQDCQSVKTGKFRIMDDTDSTKINSILTRTGNIQIEDVPQYGIQLQCEVIWTSDCTYELRKLKVIKGDFTPPPEINVIFVKILKVTADYYTAELSSNFSDQKYQKDIRIIR